MHKYVFNFLRDNAVITSLQSDYVIGDSTVNQLADIYNTFYKALDDDKEVRAIFCDIRKNLIECGLVGRPQTSSSPPVIFIARRPKAAFLFWFFGDFRCGALWLFTLYINIKIGKNSC